MFFRWKNCSCGRNAQYHPRSLPTTYNNKSREVFPFVDLFSVIFLIYGAGPLRRAVPCLPGTRARCRRCRRAGARPGQSSLTCRVLCWMRQPAPESSFAISVALTLGRSRQVGLFLQARLDHISGEHSHNVGKQAAVTRREKCCSQLSYRR
jgi:hypothetical protein